MAPELSHKRVGIEAGHDHPFYDSLDPSFVHNVYGYDPGRVDAQTAILATQTDITPDNAEAIYSARKKFYDLPPQGSYDPTAQPGDDDMKLYWLRENMQALCYMSGEIKWGRFTSRDVHVFRRYRTEERHIWNRFAAGLGSRYQDQHPPTQGVFAVEASRYDPSYEAAYLRIKRRRRDRNRRERIRASKEGLSALGSTF